MKSFKLINIVLIGLMLFGCRDLTPLEAARAVKCAETYVKERIPELRSVRVCIKRYERCLNSCTVAKRSIFMDIDDAYDAGIYQAYKDAMEFYGGAVLLTWEAHLIAVTLHEFGHTYDYLVKKLDDSTERTANMFMLAHIKGAIEYCQDTSRELLCDTCMSIFPEYKRACRYEVSDA